MVSTTINGAPSSQPVRFYKFVALTFLIITLVLLGAIIFMSAKRADITIVTRSEPVEAQGTVLINSSDSNAVVPGFVTSTVVSIEKTFNPEGSKTEEGISEGTVMLINDSDLAQPLVATTRLLTPDGVLFRMKNAVTVPANGSAEVAVYADEKGTASDIGPSTFTIPGLNETKQKVIYAKSEAPMSGGIRKIGVLSQEDIDKAQQILVEDIRTKGSELLNTAFAQQVGLYEVSGATFSHDAELGVETSSYVLSGTATVVGVFYDQPKLTEYAQGMLQKQVVDNSEILQSMEGTPSVVLRQFDASVGTAELVVSYSGLVDIDPNAKELQKLMFFGKSEDEVKRYVMSLDHVQGVEMHFRPMWNRSVPHVADHVSITIKQVE
jgi:hypothetical protein